MGIGENNKITPKIVASSYDSLLFEKYHLSIELSLSNFNYTILNTDNFHYELFHCCQINSKNESIDLITDVCNKEKLLGNQFSSSSLIFSGFPNTLIPKSIYTKKDQKEILALNQELDGEIITDSLKTVEIYNITSVPDILISNMKELFPGIKMKTRTTILIDYFSKYIENEKEKAFVCNQENYIEIIVFKKGRLILQNIFHCKNKEDKVYYILFCLSQLEISAETCPTVLFGDINKNDSFLQMLSNYIHHVVFAERPQNLYFPSEFDNLESQKFLTLFTQVLCV